MNETREARNQSQSEQASCTLLKHMVFDSFGHSAAKTYLSENVKMSSGLLAARLIPMWSAWDNNIRVILYKR